MSVVNTFIGNPQPMINGGPPAPPAVTVAGASPISVAGGPAYTVSFSIAGQARGDVVFYNGVAWVRLPAGVTGQLLATQGVGADPVWRNPTPSMLVWGNGSVAATTTARYMTPGYDSSSAPTTLYQMRMAVGGTLRNMRVHHNNPNGNGNNIVYTFRKGGVVQTLAVTIASTAADGSDLVNSFSVVAGDLLDIQVTKALAIGTSPADISITAEFAP